MLKIGVRVVRGPDWKWDTQDSGEGHCGTVIDVGNSESEQYPDKTVVVLWDNGFKNNYRAGYGDFYDLRLYDNAPSGVKHPTIICDGCKIQGIVGIRYKCTKCYDFDLCLNCYMADVHDVNHIFQRFETLESEGLEMPARSGCIQVELKGIFVGAKVVRGEDWNWNDQDGGDGKTGRVMEIRDWEKETFRSVANVTWAHGTTNLYRLGHKGKVDLKCIEATIGGYYYRDHIPILGFDVPTTVPNAPKTFNQGDKVRVTMGVDTLKEIQEGHGGWNPKMQEYIGKIGIVHRVTDRGDIRVQYEGCNNRWTFHPGTLTKLDHFYKVGDIVQMSQEANLVKEYQKGHGEWIEVMRSVLGKRGNVIKVYPDGDLRVSFDLHTYTLNPLCVQPVSIPNLVGSLPYENSNPQIPRDRIGYLSNLVENIEISNIDTVVREAAQGHIEMVRKFLRKHPDKVDIRSQNKTSLHVACHQGHKDLVFLLLRSGASVALTDDDGDTALHYATFGNQPDIMKILIQHGSDINAINKGLCSPLHVAVNKQHIECVEILLHFNANVNFQDSYGDTALHDAIGKESADILEMLIDVPTVNFQLINKRGFNVLHHAALKGNNFAAEKILPRARELVDIKKDDGFASLHLSCLNGHRAVAETLVNIGQAQINQRNNRQQTPLHLAVSQGHCAIVEFLVSNGADIHSVDDEGDNALHLAIKRKTNTSVEELEAPTIYGIWTQISERIQIHEGNSVSIAVACYLVQEGCSLDVKNKNNKTPLDLVTDTNINNILNKWITTGEPATVQLNLKGVETDLSGDLETEDEEKLNSESHQVPTECSVCSELSDENVLFEPCMHKIACEDCSARMKKCFKCNLVIDRRVTKDGRIILCKSKEPSAERLRYLESKIAEIEEAHCCSICMERKRNVAFLCGHGACDKCSHTLAICHMCRKTITKKINLY